MLQLGKEITGTWIKCVLVDKKPKTNVWAVTTIEDNIVLGWIKWFPKWRKYSFFPMTNTVYEPLCLYDIARFTRNFTEEHKNVKTSEFS